LKNRDIKAINLSNANLTNAHLTIAKQISRAQTSHKPLSQVQTAGASKPQGGQCCRCGVSCQYDFCKHVWSRSAARDHQTLTHSCPNTLTSPQSQYSMPNSCTCRLGYPNMRRLICTVSCLVSPCLLFMSSCVVWLHFCETSVSFARVGRCHSS
jgi:hypothetical protein